MNWLPFWTCFLIISIEGYMKHALILLIDCYFGVDW
jgi:hypothetical protein